MFYAYDMGRLLGIPFKLHGTFILLVAVLVGTQAVAAGLDSAFWLALFLSGLFGSVVLHELGHAIAARAYGIGTRDITLLPIGGVARLERMPANPLQELVVALAGPAVNVGIVIVLATLVTFASLLGADPTAMLTGSLLGNLLIANVTLAIFNMLPAFPMDGGRVLRAVLAMGIGPVMATTIASRIGQAMAVLFGVVGLSYNPFLILIAIFIWFAAEHERRQVILQHRVGNLPLRQLMRTRIEVLPANMTLPAAAEHMFARDLLEAPVADGAMIIGVIDRNDVVQAIAEQGETGRLASVLQPATIIDIDELAEASLGSIEPNRFEGPSLLVVDHGRLIGMITRVDLTSFLVLADALGEAQALAIFRGAGSRIAQLARAG
jgi:Zn-dependent protease/CBS domain-containing protein